MAAFTSAGLGQMLLEIHRLAVAADAERFRGQIEVDAAGEGVSDDQRRRSQIVRPHLGVDPPLEIAIAAQNCGDDQLIVGDLLRDRLGQGAAVADACRATVADHVEVELL